MRTPIALVARMLGAVLALGSSQASPDAIPGPPDWECLPGTHLSLGHGGTNCTPTDCSRDGVCPDGLVCAEAVALFPEPGSPPPFPEMRPVAADCACDPMRCVRARWCVPPDAEPYVCPASTPTVVRPDHAGAASCDVARIGGSAGAVMLVLVAIAGLVARSRRRRPSPGLTGRGT